MLQDCRLIVDCYFLVIKAILLVKYLTPKMEVLQAQRLCDQVKTVGWIINLGDRVMFRECGKLLYGRRFLMKL